MAIDMESTKAKRSNAKILAAIETQPRTREGIIRLSGLSLSTADVHLAALRAAGLIHVAGWGVAVGAGKRPRLYLAGPGEDVPYPVRRVATTEHLRAGRKRKPAGTDVLTPKRKSTEPVVIHRDPLSAAFFGDYKGQRA